MRLLNLGCGSRFHPDWTNIDMNSSSPFVQAHNLRLGIPYPDRTFDAVYHSHLLEHFAKNEAIGLMQECFRVLKPGGIIRVVVPDLEQIARMYLKLLNKVLQGEEGKKHDYDWILLELYDQTVRDRPGGEMLNYLKQNPIPNRPFVEKRIGSEAYRIYQTINKQNIQKTEKHSSIDNLIRHIRNLPQRIRTILVKTLLSEKEYKALQVGLFRSEGEIHKWMYDRFSLARLIKQAGFQNPEQRTALESAIENWRHFNLDAETDGTVNKPDSLYMEAEKP